MRKIVFPQESNLQPLDYRSTALPLELEKMPPRMLNFGYLTEVESSRTDFEVLGLGLEASSPQKLACSLLEDSTIFGMLKFCEGLEKFFGKRFLVEIA